MAEARRNYAAEEKAVKQQLTALTEERRRHHDHKPGQEGKIIPLHDSSVMFPGKNEMPDTTVYCTGCGAYFESTAYTPEELQSGIYMFTSMLHQIKMNAKLSDQDAEFIQDTFASLDNVAKAATYYNDMVKKMGKGNGGGGGKNHGSGKGHMGMNSGMMRGY